MAKTHVGKERAAAGRPPQGRMDLFLAAGAALVGALVVLAEPAGSMLRLVLTLPVLFLVPGYLLLQTLVVPTPSRGGRVRQVVVAVGVSPAIVGLLALSTVLLPGGFRSASIVALVTVFCFAAMVVAYVRRSLVERGIQWTVWSRNAAA